MNKIANEILILSDTLDFGGHEVAFLGFFAALLNGSRFRKYYIVVPSKNRKFIEKLAAIGDSRIEIVESEFVKGRGEPYFAPIKFNYHSFIRQLYRKIGPETVLLLQGRVENLCAPLLALPRSANVVSYIPMAHSIQELRGASWKTRFQDLVRTVYYRRPDRFIVPSQAVAEQLVKRGARSPIFVARNYVPREQTFSQAEARMQLGLPQGARVAAFIGRFEAQQKGIDLLLPLIERAKDWTFLFIGTGEYEGQLEAVKRRGVKMELVGWTSQVSLYLDAVDVLLLPSRYEGVPLILLQALTNGTPVLASKIDAYLEYLPPENLSSFSPCIDLEARLENLTSAASKASFRKHAADVMRTKIDVHQSTKMFCEALAGGLDVEPEKTPVIHQLG